MGLPDIYLGNKVTQVTLANGVKAWVWGSSQYFQAACRDVDNYLRKKGKCLPKHTSAPWLTIIDLNWTYHQN